MGKIYGKCCSGSPKLCDALQERPPPTPIWSISLEPAPIWPTALAAAPNEQPEERPLRAKIFAFFLSDIRETLFFVTMLLIAQPILYPDLYMLNSVVLIIETYDLARSQLVANATGIELLPNDEINLVFAANPGIRPAYGTLLGYKTVTVEGRSLTRNASLISLDALRLPIVSLFRKIDEQAFHGKIRLSGFQTSRNGLSPYTERILLITLRLVFSATYHHPLFGASRPQHLNVTRHYRIEGADVLMP